MEGWQLYKGFRSFHFHSTIVDFTTDGWPGLDFSEIVCWLHDYQIVSLSCLLLLQMKSMMYAGRVRYGSYQCEWLFKTIGVDNLVGPSSATGTRRLYWVMSIWIRQPRERDSYLDSVSRGCNLVGPSSATGTQRLYWVMSVRIRQLMERDSYLDSVSRDVT